MEMTNMPRKIIKWVDVTPEEKMAYLKRIEAEYGKLEAIIHSNPQLYEIIYGQKTLRSKTLARFLLFAAVVKCRIEELRIGGSDRTVQYLFRLKKDESERQYLTKLLGISEHTIRDYGKMLLVLLLTLGYI